MMMSIVYVRKYCDDEYSICEEHLIPFVLHPIVYIYY
jgi:hypothetical protein